MEAAEPGWALSVKGLSALRGRSKDKAATDDGRDNGPETDVDNGNVLSDPGNTANDEELEAAFKALHAAVARTKTAIAGGSRPADRSFFEHNALTHDPDWDEDARLDEWRRAIGMTDEYPPLLAAALALTSWKAIEPLEHIPWIGRQLAAALLQSRGKTRSHFACLNVGLKAIPHERRRSNDETNRLVAMIEAFAVAAEIGLKDHDRWLTVRAQLERKLERRRSTSKLPALVDYMMSLPIASAAMIAKELQVTPRAAQDLVGELGLREATGRNRYRAWGIL